jgi:hypothetical protein
MAKHREAAHHLQVSRPRTPSAEQRQQQIAWRAYDLYVARGYQQGHDLEDWLTAEREIADAA